MRGDGETASSAIGGKDAAAVHIAIEQAALVGMRIGADMYAAELAAARAANEAMLHETVALVLDRAILELEHAEAVRDAVTRAEAAEAALAARVRTLEQQLAAPAGGCWLDALGGAKRAAAAAEGKAAALQTRVDKLGDVTVGPRLLKKGDALVADLASAAAIRAAARVDELAAPPPTCAAEVGLTERRVDQLAAHVERQLFAVGEGDVDRTRYVYAALLKRSAVQALLGDDPRRERKVAVAMAMLESAKEVLAHLTTGAGTRSLADHERFETILTALTPTDVHGSISTIEELLHVHHEQIDRAAKRKAALDDAARDGVLPAGAFSHTTKVARKQRKDYRGWGRCVAIQYWHKATRLDTRLGKKKRHREVDPATGEIFYREHWRHVQYDTDAQIAADFFASVDYQQYLADGGLPFSKDVFLQAKCFCIDKSDFQECACPTCTLMRETLRAYHQQRARWHRAYDEVGAAPCACGLCAKGSAFREASASLGKLRAFVHAPCGKASFAELAIQSGPKRTEATVELYRRQCCRAPLPDDACPHRRSGAKAKDACADCADCEACGWAATMPKCPVEYSEQADAEWKEYKPRLEPDGAAAHPSPPPSSRTLRTPPPRPAHMTGMTLRPRWHQNPASVT
jgi:hypothetical protein